MSTYENFNIQVKGYTVFGEKALTVVRILAFCIDALVFICGYFFFSMLYYLSPLPGLLDTALLIFLFLIYKFSFEKYLHCTVGQWFWKIKKTNKIYIQKEKLSIPNLSAVISLTIIFFSCSIYIFYTWIYQHPMLQKASIITIKSADLEQNISYERLPWFYTIGYWPKYFIDSEPLSFSLPYEKGPPLKFPGHIIVHWQKSVILSIAGPITYPELNIENNRFFFKRCLLRNEISLREHYDCLRLREKILFTYFKKALNNNPTQLELNWFEAKSNNNAIQTQGPYFKVKYPQRLQDHYLLINNKGTLHEFILEYPNTELGTRAQEMFTNSISSIRLTDELIDNQNLINQRLLHINLKELEKAANINDFNRQIAEIQYILLSKISTDPKTFESYFHLAGTTMLLIKRSIQVQNAELVSMAKSLFFSAYQYAKDIDPSNQKILQLEQMWNEIKKY